MVSYLFCACLEHSIVLKTLIIPVYMHNIMTQSTYENSELVSDLHSY